MSLQTFTWKPDWTPTGDEAPRVLKSQFGDGYTQRTGDGINTNLPKWSFNFTARSQAEYTAIRDFLRDRNATEQFYFTAPGESVQQRWVCPTWKPAPYTNGTSFGISANFEAQP